MRYPVGKNHQEFKDTWYNAQGFGVKTSYGYHEGDDFNLKTGGNSDLGQPLYAIADGEVTSVHEHATGFGKHIHIHHPKYNVWSHYAHMDSIKVRVGQKVFEGEVVGTLGKSGNSPSAHLHFAIKKQPTGIDAVAKTQTDLAKWENPTTFLAKHVVSTSGAMTEKTYSEAEMTKVRLERDSNWDRGEKYRKDYEAFVAWVVDKLKPSGVLPPLTDESYAKTLIEGIIENESKLQKELIQKEKEWALEKSELLIEQKDLIDRITQLDDALLQAQGVNAKLSDELSILKKDVEVHKEKIEKVNQLEAFITALKGLFRRFK